MALSVSQSIEVVFITQSMRITHLAMVSDIACVALLPILAVLLRYSLGLARQRTRARMDSTGILNIYKTKLPFLPILTMLFRITGCFAAIRARPLCNLRLNVTYKQQQTRQKYPGTNQLFFIKHRTNRHLKRCLKYNRSTATS